MTPLRSQLVTLTALIAIIVSCGKSPASTPSRPPENKPFSYAEFVARTPVDHLDYDEENILDSDDYDPHTVSAQVLLEKWDAVYAQVGISTRSSQKILSTNRSTCKQGHCSVWVFVDKAQQRLSLYIDGALIDTWLVSTGMDGHGTPDFETHPDGRIFDKYTSGKYPGGDYNGLGNMPYAVFISGGFAIHGTPKGNWSKLGQKASHGCIRVHPDNGYRFNRLVREMGIENTWISVD